MTPQEPAMGVSDEARDLMGQLVSLAAFHDEDLARNIAERLDAALPHMQPAGEAVGALRDALADMLSGWRYIRLHYGDLGGVGWDRAEQKAAEALATPPRPSAEPQQEAQGAVADFDAKALEVAREIVGMNGKNSCTYQARIQVAVIAAMRWATSTPPAPVDVRALRAALQQIADWKLPPTNQQWPSGNPVSYEAAFGSNGARDYMRQVATEALALLSAQQPSADARDADEERLLGPWEEHYGRAYIDACCVEGVWTHPDHVFEFVEKRARELHQAALGGGGGES